MNKRIVVIEDNQDVRENIAEILELSGYAVDTAENGVEGVRKIKEVYPDLIICDIMMPELDGYGVLHIMQRNPETASIPFIFLTAKSEKTDFRKGMNLGADDYITKPFEEVELMEAIEIRLKKNEGILKNPMAEKVGLTLNNEEILQCMNPLAEDAEVRSYPKKAPVFLEGSYPRYLFKVEEGAIKESRWTEFGKELITNIYTAGDYFGWSGLILNESYKSISSALEDTTLSLIPKEDILELLGKRPDLYQVLLKQCIHENYEMIDKLIKTAYESVRKRMSYLLTMLYSKYNKNGKPEIHLLREDIAALAGISKETAIRVLSSFKEEGLIEISNNVIMISDIEKLENVVG